MLRIRIAEYTATTASVHLLQGSGGKRRRDRKDARAGGTDTEGYGMLGCSPDTAVALWNTQ